MTTHKTTVHHAGHRSGIPGWPTNDLAGIFDALERWILDPIFVAMDDGHTFTPEAPRQPYKCLNWMCRETRQTSLEGVQTSRYILTAPIDPERPLMWSYSGNFMAYSFGFHVTTDDPEVIARLDAAIAANMQRPEFQQALAHIRERNARWAAKR